MKRLMLLAGIGICAAVSMHAEKAVEAGYTVMVELSVNEAGGVESSKVIESENEVLTGIAPKVAGSMKLAPRLKDGVPVKYKVTAPLFFPVEGDGGPEAQKRPMPVLIKPVGPDFPWEHRQDTVAGGAILQVKINEKGRVTEATVVRASHPEYGRAAAAALKRWTFKPATADGKPVEVVRFASMAFEPNGAKADWRWYVAPRPYVSNFVVTGRYVPLNSAEGQELLRAAKMQN